MKMKKSQPAPEPQIDDVEDGAETLRSGMGGPTIREVAALAEVSIGTVSRVLSGSVPVSLALSKRVSRAAQDLGYVARPRQRGAAQDRAARMISCYVSDLSNLLYGYVVSAAEERLAQLGYTLLVANTHNEARREDELLSLLRNDVVEGAIISFGEETRPSLGADLARAGVPAVILDRQAPDGIDCVSVDHYGGALRACSYLLELGHRRIGMVTASARVLPGQRRIAAFCDAYRRLGLAPPLHLIRTECATADAAFAETTRLCSGEGRPTALLTLGSQALGGTLRAIRGLGLSIPEDISVICFGDTEMAKVVSPTITCVHWDRFQLGRQAVDMLTNRIRHRFTDARSIVLPCEIILRQSCSSPRAE
ncbi:MAG: LacI family DNA-binding transcriptional regulator [Rhodobacteraceae bacterium]|nr:LacI family DNA-binding transcriptional regulator [Paracoccaceae bacterium]